jgi:exosortase/archaeosortase family protein
MWGLLELNFSAPLLVRAMPPTIIATAMVMKTGLIAMAINKTSKVFVDITSKLVNVMLRISNTPIRVHENVANVSNGIVVIGSGCSGLDAFLLYLLASLLLIHHRKFTVKEAALIVIGSLGVIPLNAIRIFTLLFIGQKWGISYLKLFHSHLGDMMFIAYVFAYWTLVIRHFSREEGPKNFYILNRT